MEVLQSAAFAGRHMAGRGRRVNPGEWLMIYSIKDKKLEMRGAGHFVAPCAQLIGDIILEDQVSVWFNVVIRADNDRIHIGARSNIQDGSVLHVDPGVPLTIGSDVTVGHKAMLHGCRVGDHSLIGINAVVLNHADIGSHCIIGANALVTEGMKVPDGSMVLGSPGKILRQLDEKQRALMDMLADGYVANAALYRDHLQVDPRFRR